VNPARRDGATPTKILDEGLESGIKGSVDGHYSALERMRECELGGMKQQAVAAERVPGEPVVPSIAIGRVAYDRVEDMLQVAAYLVPAPGVQIYFEKGKARCWVASAGNGDFCRCEAPA
jgi:hypothetical protein